VLKNFGQYNIFYGSVLRFYFFSKRIGINLTARQSEILLSLITAVAVSAGIVTAAGLIIFSRQGYKTLPTLKGSKITIERQSEVAIKGQTAKKVVLTNRLGITQILSDKQDEELASAITDKLCSSLKNIKSTDKIVFRKTDGIDKSVNRILTGRLSRAGNTYLLSLSIANAETGKILYDKNYSFKETDQIDGIINKAAENIGSSKEVR
jgi:hypothetical protein